MRDFCRLSSTRAKSPSHQPTSSIKAPTNTTPGTFACFLFVPCQSPPPGRTWFNGYAQIRESHKDISHLKKKCCLFLDGCCCHCERPLHAASILCKMNSSNHDDTTGASPPHTLHTESACACSTQLRIFSKKQRKPGFCDRVLWSAHAESVDGMKLGVTQLHYTSHPEDTRSDHKPVSASFDVQVQFVIDTKVAGFNSTNMYTQKTGKVKSMH